MQKIIWCLLVLAIALLVILPVSSESYQAPIKPPIKEYAEQKVLEVFGEGQWSYFDKVVNDESKWDHLVKNPRSSAYGLCQTMLSLHKPPQEFLGDEYMQVDWCIEYTKSRYKTPEKASKFWDKNRWF